MWKKLKLDQEGANVSAATALVLLAIDELNAKEEKGTYGYEIMAHLRDQYNWNVKSGTVYPILKKLSTDGLIHIEIRTQASNRNQIYYSITAKGKKLIEQIKVLNDNALEAAFEHEPDIIEKESLQTIPISAIGQSKNLDNFAEKILSPFLINLNTQILNGLSETRDPQSLEKMKVEIQKAQVNLSDYLKLLQNHLTTIETMKKFQK
jgi:DNA-binding PadR family transcriptional regulator